jgi:hypothetical protein
MKANFQVRLIASNTRYSFVLRNTDEVQLKRKLLWAQNRNKQLCFVPDTGKPLCIPPGITEYSVRKV